MGEKQVTNLLFFFFPSGLLDKPWKLGSISRLSKCGPMDLPRQFHLLDIYIHSLIDPLLLLPILLLLIRIGATVLCTI